eukprot:scaffold81613_cov64-Phaeocystis_antarctica.AAC.4
MGGVGDGSGPRVEGRMGGRARISAGGGSGRRLCAPRPMTACCVCRDRHRQCPHYPPLFPVWPGATVNPSLRGGLSGRP